MTEAEWLASTEPQAMLAFLSSRESGRKLRLFASACCREMLRASDEETSQEILELAEWLADADAPEQKRNAIISILDFPGLGSPEPMTPDYALATAINATVCPNDSCYSAAMDSARYASFFHSDDSWRLIYANLLRCIFGKPFQPIALLPEWRTTTVFALAEAMYDSRDFSAMPILADALQDAGCADEAVLTHCRGPGLHVRGCHVVDACLGKS